MPLVQTLLPKIKIERKLPVNYDPKIAEMDYLAKNSTEVATKEVELITYKNVHVNAIGLIFKGLRLMKNSYPNWHPYPTLYQRQKLIKNLYFKSKIHNFKGRVLLTCADGFLPNYYHWFCDALPRINLSKRFFKEKFLLVLPKPFFEAEFVQKSLQAFGISKSNIVILDKREAAKSDLVIFPTWLMGYDQEVIATRDKLINHFKDNLKFNLGERIFISRKKAAKRKITNQEEVENLMIKYGFSIVVMEDLTFEEQISVTHNAKYIVAQHGAGLTNILFCKGDASILELKPKSFNDREGNCFYELAQAAGLKYLCQYDDFDIKNIYINALHTDIMVDLSALKNNIELMLQ